MPTLIAIGGYGPEYFNKEDFSYDRIIAADSGYDICMRFSLSPDIVVGDFDSTEFKDELLSKGYSQELRDKDFTDTELALKLVTGSYDILGGGEGRLDHILSIISLFEKYGYPRLWFTRSDTIITLKGGYKLNFKRDTELSLFSPYGATVTTDGLVWDVKDKRFDLSYLSLSNRIEKEGATIETDRPVMLRVSPSDYFNPSLEKIF